MIMEFCDFSLEKLITQKKERLFSNHFIWLLLYKMSDALFTLHSRAIVHGNVNPSNILFQDGRVFITPLLASY